MEIVETLFSKESNFDNKNILNRLDKPIDQTILNKIEQGVTSEELNNIINSGVPIFKYKTQITIHGLFPELSNSYILGYKNLFQNKNKSIGVKYNAIDEDKRQRIAKRLKCLGFHYNRNSQGTKFDIMEMINKDNFEEIKNRLISIKNNIDMSLFSGYCSLWAGQAWGCKYLCLDLNINIIFEANIEPFLNKLGATIELYNEIEARNKAEEEARRADWERERQEAQKAKEASASNKADQLKLLEQYQRVEKTNKPGKYILRDYNSENELIFKVVYLYLPKGKQKPRFNRKSFDTIQEAINYNPVESWNDSIYSSKLTGYKIA